MVNQLLSIELRSFHHPLNFDIHGHMFILFRGRWSVLRIQRCYSTFASRRLKEYPGQLSKLAELKQQVDSLDHQNASEVNFGEYIDLLQACWELNALSEGRKVHAHIVKSGFGQVLVLGNSLIKTYGKCGSLEDARRVMEAMAERDGVTWNSIIAAHSQHGLWKQSLKLFEQMQLDGAVPNNLTFSIVLNACANPVALAKGKLVHGRACEIGMSEDAVVANALINMYGKCECFDDARDVFDKMPHRNVITWNTMIAAYARKGYWNESYNLFQQMQHEGVALNKITFVTLLNAMAGSSNVLATVKLIHPRLTELGFGSDVIVGTALANMYSKCGDLQNACSVFMGIEEKNVVSWTAMVAAYTQHGHYKEAFDAFEEMQLRGVKPNKITFMIMLSACCSPKDLEAGKKIHELIDKRGVECDILLGNSVINMYSKCGSFEDAYKMFQSMHKRDLVTWNAMLAAFTLHGRGKLALQLFKELQLIGMSPDTITFSTVANACGNVAALAEGKVIHGYVLERGLELDCILGTALFDMYAKCGNLDRAQSLFDAMPERDLYAWNTMIGGYAQHGHVSNALEIFYRMQQECVNPDTITFLSILSACNHAGKVEDACFHFMVMGADHGFKPIAEHYGCMIDLLGRAGWLKEAEESIKKMPIPPNAVLWMALLGASRIHGDMDLGRRAAERVLELDPQRAPAYVILSNIYAAAGKFDDVARVRKMMADNCVRKEPGRSSIEIHKKVHEFIVGDKSHPQTKEIYAELNRLSRLLEMAGYMPDTKLVLHDVEEEQKEHLLCYHSEKLAIAFGLISMPDGRPLRIIKNLRVCGDCHTSTKFITKLVRREIFLRDANRFHHFKDGVCSCGDYW